MKPGAACIGAAFTGLPLIFGLLFGCEEETASERAADIKRAAEAELVESVGAPVVTSPAPVATGLPAPAGGEAPAVLLGWDHIGKLHQTFFRDAGATSRLASDLAPHLNGAPRVLISYDDPKVQGSVILELGAGSLKRSLPVTDLTVVLQDLAPLTMALSTYRDAIGMRYDLRIANFQVVLGMENAGITCRFSPVKTSPNNGGVVSPCIVLGGAPICGEPAEGAAVSFPEPTMKRLRLCLGI